MLFQVFSVIGAFMVLTAYGLLQSGVWSELNAGYLAFNIIGSLLLGVVAIEDQRAGFICWSLPGRLGIYRGREGGQGSANSGLIRVRMKGLHRWQD